MLWEWSFFAGFDDETLVPINLTYREMALLMSAISVLEDFEIWDTEEDYFSDVVPMIGLLMELMRQDNE